MQVLDGRLVISPPDLVSELECQRREAPHAADSEGEYGLPEREPTTDAETPPRNPGCAALRAERKSCLAWHAAPKNGKAVLSPLSDEFSIHTHELLRGRRKILDVSLGQPAYDLPSGA